MAALILPASIFLCGCSNKVDRLVGNERVIRGPGGLGTTVGGINFVNRDTYVTAGTVNFGPALLLGQVGLFEARPLFGVSSWSLPNATLQGFTAIAVELVIPQRQILGIRDSISADLWLTSVAWDSSGWSGPPLASKLGSTTYKFIGDFRVNLGPGGYDSIKAWAAVPSRAPGFELVPTSSGTVGSFQTAGAVFRVTYQRDGTSPTDSTIETEYTDTQIPLKGYIHSPQGAQTGAETAMAFGGAYEAALAVRGPVPPTPDGNSVNELRIVLPVTGTSPALNGAAMPDEAFLTVDVFRIRSPWLEGVTDATSLTFDATPVARLSLPAFHVLQDTSLAIPLPRALTREWGADSTSNEGVLIKIRDVTVRPAPSSPLFAQTPAESPSFLIGSRESSRPPYIRVSTTTPPPGRF